MQTVLRRRRERQAGQRHRAHIAADVQRRESDLVDPVREALLRVGTQHVVPDAVTQSASGKNDASLTLTGSFQDLATAELRVEVGEEVYVFGFAGADAGSVVSRIAHQLVRDSTVLVLGNRRLDGADGIAVVDIDAPAAGTYVYRYQARFTLSGGPPDPACSNRRLILLKRKR